MYGKRMKKYIFSALLAVLTLTACDKVSPAGILIANTDVDDRITTVEALFGGVLAFPAQVLVVKPHA